MHKVAGREFRSWRVCPQPLVTHPKSRALRPELPSPLETQIGPLATTKESFTFFRNLGQWPTELNPVATNGVPIATHQHCLALAVSAAYPRSDGDNRDGSFRGQGNVESRRIRVGWASSYFMKFFMFSRGLEGILIETEVGALLNELEWW